MFGSVKIRGEGENILSLLRERLEGFDDAARAYGSRLMNSREVKEFVIAANIFNLGEGIRPDGSKISKIPTGKQQNEGYEESTKRGKRKKGQPEDIITLYDYGNFYAGIEAKSGSESIYIIDKDPKTDKIEEVWGNVLGITEEQTKELAEYLRPFFEKFTQDYFKLT